MEIGDAVIVNLPAWRDATGREYDPGKHHGWRGKVIETTGYKVGGEELLIIDFESRGQYGHWTGELKHG